MSTPMQVSPNRRTPSPPSKYNKVKLLGPHTSKVSQNKIAERILQLANVANKDTITIPKSHYLLSLESYEQMKNKVVGQIAYIDKHVPDVANTPEYDRLVNNVKALLDLPLGLYGSIIKNAVNNGYTLTEQNDFHKPGSASAPPSPNQQWGGSRRKTRRARLNF